MANESNLGPLALLRGLCRMTPQRAQRGYRLGCFLAGMREPAARTAFAQDGEASMAAFGLSEAERDLVRRRDYDAMLDYGASNVAIGKAASTLGTTLLERGAAGRGQSASEFIAGRRARNEGQPWQF